MTPTFLRWLEKGEYGASKGSHRDPMKEKEGWGQSGV